MIYFIFLSFIYLKVYSDSPRGFHLGISYMHILCFNEFNPLPLIILALLPCCPVIQQLIMHFVRSPSYIDALFQYFSLFNILFPYLISHSLINHTTNKVFSLSLFLSLCLTTFTQYYVVKEGIAIISKISLSSKY
jgi:hypothetical protein